MQFNSIWPFHYTPWPCCPAPEGVRGPPAELRQLRWARALFKKLHAAPICIYKPARAAGLGPTGITSSVAQLHAAGGHTLLLDHPGAGHQAAVRPMPKQASAASSHAPWAPTATGCPRSASQERGAVGAQQPDLWPRCSPSGADSTVDGTTGR